MSELNQTGPPAAAPCGTEPYAVSVEIRLPVPLAQDQADALVDLLVDWHGAVSGLQVGQSDHRVSLTFDVEAASTPVAAQAGTDVALDLLARAGVPAGPVVALEVLTVPEQTRRLAEPLLPELLGLHELSAMLGVSKERVRQLREREDFPRPLAELRSGPIWGAPTMSSFLAGWTRKPGRPRRPSSAPATEPLGPAGSAAHPPAPMNSGRP